MTPTTRWVIAQRRKRQVITRTVRDRALYDPRRHKPAVPPRRTAPSKWSCRLRRGARGGPAGAGREWVADR